MMSTQFKREQPGKMSDRFEPTPPLSHMDLLHVSSGASSSVSANNVEQHATCDNMTLFSVQTPELSLPTCLSVGAPPTLGYKTFPWSLYLSWTSLSLHALVSLSSLLFYLLLIHIFPLAEGAPALVLMPICHTNKGTLI